MTIKKLKQLIQNCPEDAIVLAPASDHAYRDVEVEVTTGLYSEEDCVWSEDYGEESTPEEEYGKRQPVVVIR